MWLDADFCEGVAKLYSLDNAPIVSIQESKFVRVTVNKYVATDEVVSFMRKHHWIKMDETELSYVDDFVHFDYKTYVEINDVL